MGIQKNFVQALVTESIVMPGPESMYRVLYHKRIDDCDFVLQDHNILLYKTMCVYNAVTFNLDEFVNTLVKSYLKYTISKSGWLFMISDGASFALKVAARHRRANSPGHPMFEAVWKHGEAILEMTFRRLSVLLGGRAVCVCGVNPRDETREYKIRGLAGTHLETAVAGALGAKEVEADLVQFRLAAALAAAFPTLVVGVVSIDTDLPMIASAVVNVTGRCLPPNLVVFFQTKMLKSDDSMGALCNRYKIASGERRKTCLTRLTTTHGAHEGALRYVLDDDDPTEAERGVWRRLCADADPVETASVVAGAGVMGPLAKKWLDAAFYDEGVGRAVLRAVKSKTAVKTLVDLLYSHETTKELLKDAVCLMTTYKRGGFAYNTFGHYRKILALEYVPLTPMPPTKRTYAAVLLAVLGGTDYNIPLHKFGLQQMLTAYRRGDAATLNVVDYEDVTGGYLKNTFLKEFTKLKVTENHNKVWDACASQLKTVVRGWVFEGRFLETYDNLVYFKQFGGFRIKDGEIGFAVDDEQLRKWKSSIKYSGARS